MRRREFAAVAGIALAAPRALAQAGRKATVVVLSNGKSDEDDVFSPPFFDELRRRGWTEGRNIAYERLFSEGSRTRLAEIAAVAARRSPDLIFAPNGASAAAAVKATSSVPIVFVMVSDPVSIGVVSSLARPGRNATGVYHLGGESIPKRLELAREAIPGLKRVGVLLDTQVLDYAVSGRQHEEAARPKDLSLHIIEVPGFDGVAAAFEQMRKAGARAVTMNQSFTFGSRRSEFSRLATGSGLALIAYRGEWAGAGALFSYGADFTEALQRSAAIADRVLRGAAPDATPVEQASKFELVVNLRTAKALGLRLPRGFLARADRVIE